MHFHDATILPPSNPQVASPGTEAAFNRASETLSLLTPRSNKKVFLSQFFSMTRNGPVYLGARLDLPNLSSLMYTYEAVLNDLAMKGDARNFVRSNVCGA